jgi:hypothetical protein
MQKKHGHEGSWRIFVIGTGDPTKNGISLIFIMVQCEAPKIAKLVYNSNNYGLWYL